MDIEQIRVRIMSEAYDLADRGDSEGYNAIKVMCGDVLESIAAVVAAERDAVIAIVNDNSDSDGVCCTDDLLAAIRART